MRNHSKWIRVISTVTAVVLMLAMLSACDSNGNKDDGTLPNGNVLTVQEEGSEKELTAVRENLIKATEIEGLGEITKMEFYENGVRSTSDKYVLVKDNKKFYYSGDIKRVVNYPDGYILDIPADWKPDFTLATARCVYENDEVTLSVSDETEAVKTYKSPDLVLEYTFQNIRTDDYAKKNRIEKLKEETVELGDGMKAYILKLKVNDLPEGVKNYYTYVAAYNEVKMTRMIFKTIDDRDFADVYNTYRSIYDKGAAVDTIKYPEGGNPNWAPETKELYDRIMNTDHVIWGMYNGNIDWDPLEMRYPITEKQVDHKFELVSSYTDEMTYDFPVELAQKIDNDGRLIQFTFHYQYQNGEQIADGLAPSLNVYRGELDEEFREMARGIVEFGKPMLFRINNEMNSDWTLWSFVNTLLDPDIFTETWIRLYNILEEEGANKYLIYVWNPQDCNTYPLTQLSNNSIIHIFHKRVNDAFAVNDHIDTRRIDIKQPARFDQFQPLVHHRSGIHRNFCSHTPIRVLERILQGNGFKLLSRFAEERSARCRQNQPFDGRTLGSALQTLEDRRMFTVHGKQFHALTLHSIHHKRTARHQCFFVGERHIVSRFHGG